MSFNKPIKKATDIAGVKRSAFWHLSRRDHSEYELRLKLARKTEKQDWIDAVIEECFNYHYLDDERFIKNYIRSAQNKRLGPQRITQGLKLKGLDIKSAELTHLDDFDYQKQALDLLTQKYKKPLFNTHLKQKAMLFLQGKGYCFDDIFIVIDTYNENYSREEYDAKSEALLLLQKKFHMRLNEQKQKDKATRFLIARGYSFSDVKDALHIFNNTIDDA
ncbi:transcriptional regulator for RecA [Psychromonas sp. CNPT3]|uniref:regulatory protein RecX n=1 Tax=Psychromonas sp. CNPT3 TaxID=314282 RepID=UPI00006E423B|nr:regulatory protein RecX [Psychromonas sp. CNPT3]AGH81099.1 transcriptional regulator for RecA [Psychromonas sp. CNPT3]